MKTNMEKCDWCGKPNNNGQKFCSKKCRKAKIEANKPVYKRMMKRREHGQGYGFGVVFDYEGNNPERY